MLCIIGVVGRSALLTAIRGTIWAWHYSERTERTYVGWVKRFVRFHGMSHPSEMGEAEVSAFLTHCKPRASVAVSLLCCSADA